MNYRRIYRACLSSFCFLFLILAAFNATLVPTGLSLAAPASLAATDLSGRILLQVQDKGQAWYVNPVDGRRYYLGRPADAFSLMRSLGLGVTDADIQAFQVQVPARLAGRILLQVQDKGQAYYVDPQTLRLHYLGRPDDAFRLMREKGLGITNADLGKIAAAGFAVTAAASDVSFRFKYQGAPYTINQTFSTAWYERYKNSPKVYTYSSASPPANLRDAFYGMFLTGKDGDTAISDLAGRLKSVADAKGWGKDELAEFTLALVQYIPYDSDKLAGTDRNTNPYYPYETLYLDRGVCSDKTFLAVSLLRSLGYGSAILDFPDSNHSAVGLMCPKEVSLAGSGYCYAETTNYFPVGVVPQSISSGQAQAKNGVSISFSAANLGRMEIYQKTTGQSYGGVTGTKARAASLETAQADLDSRQAEIAGFEETYRAKERELSDLKAEMDSYYAAGDVTAYNQLVPRYNAMVREYNDGLADYQAKVVEYNRLAAELNASLNAFYQK